jgi:hypothetical protein
MDRTMSEERTRQFIDAWNGQQPAHAIADRFGITYQTAMSKAYTLRKRGYALRRRRGYTAPMKWTETAIIDALRAWHQKHGRTPTARDWMHAAERHPDHSVVKFRFGNWTTAVRAAGLVPVRDGGNGTPSGQRFARRNRSMVTGGRLGAKRNGPGGGYV